MGLIPLFVGIVGFFDDIRHLLALLVQFLLQFFIKVIENEPLSSKTIDQAFQILVVGRCLIELLISLIQPILQNLDLLLQIVLVLSSRVHSHAIFPLLRNFLLEVADVHIDALLGLFLVVDGSVNLINHLLPGLLIGEGFGAGLGILVHFRLSYHGCLR